ncbi:hypothetical protein CI610_02651 [invertebrate metagenome]|uniref:Uncharacterized protein n=1 Tax=invertebrate metagenome TaxID=1711999 RepID=A0A2H9T5A8_9ZZZZ
MSLSIYYIKRKVVICCFLFVFVPSSLQAHWLFNPYIMLRKGYFLLLSVLAVQGEQGYFNEMPNLSKNHRITVVEQRHSHPYYIGSTLNDYMAFYRSQPISQESVGVTLVCMEETFSDFYESLSDIGSGVTKNIKFRDMKPYPRLEKGMIDENGRCYQVDTGYAMRMFLIFSGVLTDATKLYMEGSDLDYINIHFQKIDDSRFCKQNSDL